MLVNCVFNGFVPLFGFTLHVAVIGGIGHVVVIVPQYVVYVFPFVSVIFSCVLL